MEQVGAVWLVAVLTGSPVLMGLLGLARAVPALVISPFAGVVVDRLDQRRLLFATQGLALLTSLTLGLLVATGSVELWHVYALVLVQSVITCFDATSRQALFPQLVDRDSLPQAVTMTVTAARTSAFIGPAIAGLAIATYGESAPFVLAAPALGSLAGLLALIVRGHAERPGRFAALCTAAYAAALLAFAASQSYVLSFVVLAAAGLLDALVTVTRNTIMQLAAPGQMRGRVMANMRTVTAGVGPLAETQSGAVAGAIGGPLALVTSASAMLAGAIWTIRTNRQLWEFRQRAATPATPTAALPVDAAPSRAE